MKTRVITAVVMALVLAPAFLFSGTYLYPVLFALVSGLGCFEMVRCIGIHKNLFVTIPAVLLGTAMPVIARVFPERCFDILSIASAIFMFWLFSVSLFSHGKLPIDTTGMAFLGLFYVIWGFGLLILLRGIPHGQYLFCLPYIGAWVSDTFAYFTGRAFGRHKLIPDVSPKKTVEGAIGGIVFAMLSFVLFGFVASKLGGGEPHYLALFLLGLPVSLVSIVGDLVMSLVKRRYGVKDYGKLFPGHGGVLDRFDSVLATSIVLYLLCANTSFFGLMF
ncbi:MAG: phosphatidate cytidylyltransferase [Clostridia bacterium]|nr:phosphatidate cytidylyltransferase [Clostridia bacterium]